MAATSSMNTEVGSPPPKAKGGGVQFQVAAPKDVEAGRPAISKSASPGGSSSGSKPWFCCLRRQPQAFKQTVIVLRHSERKDYVDPTYKTSEEGLAWPHDAPLTEAGIKLANEVAEEILRVHQKANFVTIACSPYRRCLETAAPVAKRLNLPVVIDQEIGEVRDRMMNEHHLAHRSPVELKDMAKALGIRLVNPLLQDGGVKVFGKTPVWPETLDDAHTRYVVRMETYIRKSAEDRQNCIIVTHADAVVAALQMFERGGADVQNMGFCARIIASRDVEEKSKAGTNEKGVFAAQWVVEAKAVGVELQKEAGAMGKYYEKLYLEKCDETQERVANRKNQRTKTDMMFDKALKDMAKLAPNDEDDEE